MKNDKADSGHLLMAKSDSGKRYKIGRRGMLAGRPLVHFELGLKPAAFHPSEYERVTALRVLEEINAATAGRLCMRPGQDEPYASPAVLLDVRRIQRSSGEIVEFEELLYELRRAGVPDVIVLCSGSWELPHIGRELFAKAAAGENPSGLPVPASWMDFDDWWRRLKAMHPELARECYVADVVIVDKQRGVFGVPTQIVAHELLVSVEDVVTGEDLRAYDANVSAVSRGVFADIDASDAVFSFPEWRLDHTEHVCL